MNTFISLIWTTFFSWMPLSLQILFGAFVVIAVIVMVIKVVALVLNAIPIL